MFTLKYELSFYVVFVGMSIIKSKPLRASVNKACFEPSKTDLHAFLLHIVSYLLKNLLDNDRSIVK
jgi:hypothetical protein